MKDDKTQSLFTREVTSVPEKENQVRCMGCMEAFSSEFEVCPECGYVMGTAAKMPYSLRPGLLLADKYLLGKVIGQGGFGITYIGWDTIYKRKVAIKEFFPNALSTRTEGATVVSCYNDKAERYFNEGVRKMMDEGARLSKFSGHPNIVNVYDTFEQNKTAYIVMEYLDGRSLKEYAAEKGGRLEPREAVNLMMPVIGALRDMHSENMIHRDIAPDNIYICNDGRIKLLDFGSARIAVQDAEKSLSVMVKPGYAPKEQYASRSKQGPWTDVYSVCATLYRLITGEAPVESIEREVTPLKTFEEFGITDCEVLEKIISLGLEPEITDRIATAEELETYLREDFLDAYSVEPEESYYEEQKPNKEPFTVNILLILLAAVVFMGFIGLIVFGVFKGMSSVKREPVPEITTAEETESTTFRTYIETSAYTERQTEVVTEMEPVIVTEIVTEPVTQAETEVVLENGLNSTDPQKVVSYYNKALAKTNRNGPFTMHTVVEYTDTYVADSGLLGDLYNDIFVTLNEVDKDTSMDIPGSGNLLPGDVRRVSAESRNGKTTIYMDIARQNVYVGENLSDGPAGRGFGFSGMPENLLDIAEFIEGEETVCITFDDAYIECVIDERTGEIISGTWFVKANFACGDIKYISATDGTQYQDRATELTGEVTITL